MQHLWQNWPSRRELLDFGEKCQEASGELSNHQLDSQKIKVRQEAC
jgi:hypothetical protein